MRHLLKTVGISIFDIQESCPLNARFAVKFGKSVEKSIKILPLLSFIIPMLWLFLLYPESFELMWKGRTFQLFFVWLIALELILSWENIEIRIKEPNSLRTFALAIIIFMPTFYIVAFNYFGLNETISIFSSQIGIQWWASMPITIEYMVFAFCFCLLVYLAFGEKGVKSFLLPTLFLGIVGTLYMIDNIFPYGQFSPFQIFVPSAAILAAGVLGVFGYETFLEIKNDPIFGSLPRLTVIDPVISANKVTFDIAWPCAGIESLLIFSVATLLFLKRMPISNKAKIGYFVFGMVVAYLLNILRIVAIFIIGIGGGDVELFHFYFGPLYSILWIMTYPLIIIASQVIARNLRNRINKSSQLCSKLEKINLTTFSSS